MRAPRGLRYCQRLSTFHTMGDLADDDRGNAAVRGLADALPLLVAYLDREQRYRFVNAGYERWFALPRAQVEGRTLRSVVGETAYDMVRRHVDAALRGETVAFETGFDFPGVGVREVIASYVPDRNAAGEVLGFYSVVQDVTEKKQLEGSVHHQARLVECADDAIISTDLSRVVRTWNAAAERLYGWKAEEVVGRRVVQDLLQTDYIDTTLDQVLAALSAHGRWQGEVLQTRRDGTRVIVRASVSSLFDDFGRRAGMVAVNRDVTELKHLESELLHAHKLEAIGQLASGVAHDFSNLLMGIIGFADVALSRMGGENAGRTHVLELKRAALGGTALVRQLLTYARKETAGPRVVDVHATVLGMEPMLRQLVGADVLLSVDLQAPARLVRCNSGELEQIVMNLVVNARRAMPRGGSLSLTTRGAESGLLLAVRDTGCGMDAATRERIFEPFFTTRAAGEGTGLGLSMVQKLVEHMGGDIDVESERNVGTCFIIHLPVIAGDLQPPSPPAEVRLDPGHGTVLVVEDDALVRATLQHYLERGGYSVLVAADEREAREHCRTAAEIDLLLVDVVLPGTRGDRVAAALSPLARGAPVLFMSAYPEQDALRKPFDQATLLAAVQTALGNAVRGSTVLLVEDQEMSRSATRELLQDVGYTVVDVPTATEALAVTAPVDIVVTDLNLPDMPGTELLERIRRTRKHVCALLVSGAEPTDPRLRQALDEPLTAFVRKPIDVEGLEQRMRELLRARPAV